MNFKVNAIRKLLSIVLAICLLIPSFAVYADDIFLEIDSVDLKLNELTVNIVFENPNRNPIFFMYILKPGVTLDDLKADSDTYKLFDDVLFFDELTTRSRTNMVFNYTIDDSNPSGEYTIVTKAAEYRTRTFFFANEQEREIILNEIKNEDATKESIISILEENENIAEAMGIKVNILNSLSNSSKEYMANYLLELDGKEDLDELEIVDEINLALLFATLNKEKDARKSMVAIDSLIDMFNLDENMIEIYKDLIDPMKVASVMTGQNYSSIEDVKEILESSIIVTSFNENHWQNTFTFLKNYEDFFPNLKMTGDYSFFFEDNASLNNSQIKKKDAAARAVQRGKDYKSADDITKATMSAMNSALVGSGDTPSGGGSGGSRPDSKPKATENFPIVTLPQNLEQLKVSKASDFYNDVSSEFSWADESIALLTEQGVVSGVGNREFNPSGLVTREEFIKMLVNALKINDLTATTSFTDVDKDSWYYIYVASAEKAGITQGMGDGTFGVGVTISHQDMITMVYRAVSKLGRSLTVKAQPVQISDFASISGYAREAVSYMQSAGAIPPVYSPMFAPYANSTRAEAAYVIARVLDLK